jgi:glycerol-1-phosphate dehydrogenase [NAD(P)+]
MDPTLDRLLGTAFDCECGKRHEIPVRSLCYDTDAAGKVPQILADCIVGRNAAIIADKRTWPLCGEKTSKAMEAAGWRVSRIILEDNDHGRPVCDDVTAVTLKSQVTRLSPTPSVLVAVGSGTVNDLTKWIAFELGNRYAVIATAASMNGYSAANVAPMVNGVKVLVRAAAPLAVFAEPAVIEGAPFEMTAGGFGDAVAKCLSHADWVMNNYLFGEHYCPRCSNIVESLEPLYLERPQDVKERRPAAIEALFRSLFWSGVAMTMIGTSAPASGGEHLLSHTLDMISRRDQLTHDLHGRQVGIGTIFSAALYEKLLTMESLEPVQLRREIDTGFWGGTTLSTAVAEQWSEKRGELAKMGKLVRDKSRWQSLRTALQSIVRPPSEVKDWLVRAGAANCARDIDCSRERLRDALLHMNEIRKRCTVVDLAWLAGVMPHAADEIIDRWLVK